MQRMGTQIEKCCESCANWLPMGGCWLGGFMPCDKWERSLSYQPNNEPTLWEQVFNEPDNCTEY